MGSGKRYYRILKFGVIIFLLGSMGWIMYSMLGVSAKKLSQSKCDIVRRIEMAHDVEEFLFHQDTVGISEEMKAKYLDLVYSLYEDCDEEGISFYSSLNQRTDNELIVGSATGYLRLDVYGQLSLKKYVAQRELLPSQTYPVVLNDFFSEEAQKKIARAYYDMGEEIQGEKMYDENTRGKSEPWVHVTGKIWNGIVYPETVQILRLGLCDGREDTVRLVDVGKTGEKYRWVTYSVMETIAADKAPDAQAAAEAKSKGKMLPYQGENSLFVTKYFPNIEVTGTVTTTGFFAKQKKEPGQETKYKYEYRIKKEEDNPAKKMCEEDKDYRRWVGKGHGFDGEKQQADVSKMFRLSVSRYLTGGEQGGYSITYCYYYPTEQENRKDYSFLYLQMFWVTMVLCAVLFLLLGWIERRQGALEDNRKNMTRAIAHELKTPLAIMKNYLEISTEESSQEKRREYQQIVSDEIAHMDTLILDMLELSRLEAGARKMETGEVELVSMTKGLLQRLDSILAEKEIEVTLEILPEPENGEVLAKADIKGIQMVIHNYLTNAVKNTNNGGRIQIQISSCRGKIRYEVYNTGPQLSRREQKIIWYSFYKNEYARTEQFGSSGLGLAIVKRMVKGMHGKAGCRTEKDGMLFWFTCPKM